MSYPLTILTILILLILIIYQWKVLHYKVFLSPALYFSSIWILGPIYLLIFYNNLSYDPYPEYINELNILVSFTALCFIFWTKINKKKLQFEQSLLIINRMNVFYGLCIFILLIAFYDFYRLGANINMGLARENVRENVGNQSILVGYSKTLALPLSLYSGYCLFSNLINKGKVGSLILFAPLLANLLFSINLGGRVDILLSFLHYLMGGIFILPDKINFQKYKKPIFISIIGVSLLISFINNVQSQRSVYSSGNRNEIEVYLDENYPLLSYVYSPLTYVKSSYTGYQLRRVDAVDEDNLGWGRYTFNGFINWTLPFGSLIGLRNFSIAKSLGIFYSAQETYDYEREYYNVTHSSYLTLIKDFGFKGSFICIFILTGIAHFLYLRVLRRKVVMYATSLYFFFLFWEYWTRSIFYGSLSSSILIPLYGFLLLDIFNYFGKKFYIK